MNPIDWIFEAIAPVAALKRRAARRVLSFDAGQPSRQRRAREQRRSINDLIGQYGGSVRAQVRYLEQNHDLARGILRTLVNNTIGPQGIGIEPQPRRLDGSIHAEYAEQLRTAWRDWQRSPEVTGRLSWPKVQRLVARTWLRDGEAFAQLLEGPIRSLDHGHRVPMSLELLEADMVPLDFNDSARNIAQGVERNGWGRPVAFHVYRRDPREVLQVASSRDLKRIPAERMLHVATIDRIGQWRGVSDFASVITRLDDIKDYEESERIAAKISARLTAFIRKGTPDMYEGNLDESGNPAPRELNLQAGTIIDDLGPGEDVGMIDSKRPNPNLITFRMGQLRAIAAGVGASYSSIARDYDGTYSAQRQELVEQWVHYATLTDEFVAMFVLPVWERFVRWAVLSGACPLPADLQPDSEDDALFVGQQMPWIDPLKEATSWETLTRAGFASEVEVIRRRGGNPRDVLEQISAWRGETAGHGLVFTSNAATDANRPAPAPEDPEPANARGRTRARAK